MASSTLEVRLPERALVVTDPCECHQLKQQDEWSALEDSDGAAEGRAPQGTNTDCTTQARTASHRAPATSLPLFSRGSNPESGGLSVACATSVAHLSLGILK